MTPRLFMRNMFSASFLFKGWDFDGYQAESGHILSIHKIHGHSLGSWRPFLIKPNKTNKSIKVSKELPWAPNIMQMLILSVSGVKCLPCDPPEGERWGRLNLDSSIFHLRFLLQIQLHNLCTSVNHLGPECYGWLDSQSSVMWILQANCWFGWL